MTREEEMIQAAIQRFGDAAIGKFAFCKGAQWADEHPQWRNGKEECPPVGEDVLVRCSIKGDKKLHVTGLGKYVYEDGVGCWRLGSQGGIKFNAAKCVYFYWMPIPEVKEE